MNHLTGILKQKQNLEGSLSGSLIPGLSAYEIAVKQGFQGTEEEWLMSLKGDPGESVDINVVIDTFDRYIIEFITPSKRIESPNLKGKDSFVVAANSDIENIFN